MYTYIYTHRWFTGQVLKVYRSKSHAEQEFLDIEYDDGQIEVIFVNSCYGRCVTFKESFRATYIG